jgi:hypothetical protein
MDLDTTSVALVMSESGKAQIFLRVVSADNEGDDPAGW